MLVHKSNKNMKNLNEGFNKDVKELIFLVLMVKKLVMLMFLPNPYNNYHCHEMSLIKNILPLKVLRPIFLPSRSDSTFLKNSFFHVFYHFNFFNSLVMLYCSWSASIGNNFPLDICPKSIIISGY